VAAIRTLHICGTSERTYPARNHFAHIVNGLVISSGRNGVYRRRTLVECRRRRTHRELAWRRVRWKSKSIWRHNRLEEVLGIGPYQLEAEICRGGILLEAAVHLALILRLSRRGYVWRSMILCVDFCCVQALGSDRPRRGLAGPRRLRIFQSRVKSLMAQQ